MIDIIIPVYNEEVILSEKKDYFTWLQSKARLVFVDGGSTDQTVELAQRYGTVLTAPKNRSAQMNWGAQNAQADTLLFLHADTFLGPESIDALKEFLRSGINSACFLMKVEDQRLVFRFFEAMINLRAKLFGVVDGDLGLVVRKELFQKVGGFDNVPIMEDILISKKIKRAGKIAVLPSTIRVSSREWRRKGFLKTLSKYTKAYLQLWIKTPLFKFSNASS